jgi:hypothetical protein
MFFSSARTTKTDGIIAICIINEPELSLDKDVRKLLTFIAMISEPGNIDVYFDVKNQGFSNRYATYLKEMQICCIR